LYVFLLEISFSVLSYVKVSFIINKYKRLLVYMDIQSIKRGIVLSRNEPFIKKTAKIPVPSSSPYIKFNVSSQQNTQQTYLQTSNKEISPLKHSPDKNHQVYPHSQTSIVINQVKT